MQKFLESLQEAQKKIQTADHMLYVTLTLVKDKKILLKIIVETKNAIAKLISSVLHYEYLFKRIRLYGEPKANFRTFQEKCSKRYGVSEYEIKLIAELFDFVREYEKSPMEFMKNDKIVILSENMHPKTMTIERAKEFLALSKNLLKKIQNSIQR